MSRARTGKPWSFSPRIGRATRPTRTTVIWPRRLSSSLLDRSGTVGAQDVNHEHERVRALDADPGVARLAVTVGGRDHEQNPAANLLPDEALVPAGNNLGWLRSDAGAERLATLPGGVKDL